MRSMSFMANHSRILPERRRKPPETHKNEAYEGMIGANVNVYVPSSYRLRILTTVRGMHKIPQPKQRRKNKCTIIRANSRYVDEAGARHSSVCQWDKSSLCRAEDEIKQCLTAAVVLLPSER